MESHPTRSSSTSGFTLTARFNAEAPGGVLVAQGGAGQGYTLFLDEGGKLTFLVGVGGVVTVITSSQTVSGSHTAVASLGADRSMTLSLDGQQIARTQATQLLL